MSTAGLDKDVRPGVFRALLHMDLDALCRMPKFDLRPVLSSIVRIAVIGGSSDTDLFFRDVRKRLFRCLADFDEANAITCLLTGDFTSLREDIAREYRLCEKLGVAAVEKNRDESALLRDVPFVGDLSLSFERGDANRKLRLLLREIVLAIYEVKELLQISYPVTKQCDLFEHDIYAEEVGDVLCVAMAELPEYLPPGAVAQALFRRLTDPSWLICRIVANVPHYFIEVCRSVILMNDKHDDDSPVGRSRCSVLLRLCKMNPSDALTVRSLCVELCRMPGTAVLLSMELPDQAVDDSSRRWRPRRDALHEPVESDVVSFVSGVLLSENPSVRFLFCQWIKMGQRTMKRDLEGNFSPGTVSSFNKFKMFLVSRLQALVMGDPDSFLPSEHVVEAQSILRLYCLLKCQAAYNFIATCRSTEDEASLLFRLVTARPPADPSGGRFVSLALCVLLTCPSLVSSPEKERAAVRWIRWLVKDFHAEKSSFAELLLLMAILFHGNHLSALADLVSSTLGMKLSAKPSGMQRLKAIFTQEVFTEQVVAAHAVKVSVTENLNANQTGFVPVHCIFHLVKSRVFTKHKVPIKDWVYRQLVSSSAPLHPVLPSLVEVYVHSILIPPSNRVGAEEEINDPFTEEQVLAVFGSDSEAVVTAQLLMLYYVLLYEDVRLNNMKPIMAAKRVVLKYSQQLVSLIPIKHLLLKAQNEQENYGALFPPLIKLLTTNFPHLCLVEDWLQQMEPWVSSRFKRLSGALLRDPKRMKAAVADAFENVTRCPAKAIFLLRHLRQLTAAQLRPLGEAIMSNAKMLLDGDDKHVPRLAQDLFRDVWRKLSLVYPRASWLIAANSLIDDGIEFDPSMPIKAMYKQDDLVTDPLMVLRCDPRIFRCPALFEISLRTLRGYLAASRAMLHQHTLDQPWLPQMNQKTGSGLTVTMSMDNEREELKNALITTQESAAVQILLEVAAQRNDDPGIGELRNTVEARSLVCSHLHQIFIAEPHLVKLVHFQGYSRDLLPVTVRGIPSMHICLDFLPELVTTPDVDRLVFATCLLSHLSVQYALPKALSVTRLALQVLSTLLSSLPPGSYRDELTPIFPALVRLAITFPPILSEVVGFFIQYGQIASSMPDEHAADRTSNRRRKKAPTSPCSIVKEFQRLIDQCVLSLNLT